MDQSWVPLITGSGGALVVLAILAWLLIIGKLHSDAEFQARSKEIEDLKTALQTERTVNNELAHAGGVTNRLIGALVDVAAGRHPEAADRHLPGRGADLDVPAGDLGT